MAASFSTTTSAAEFDNDFEQDEFPGHGWTVKGGQVYDEPAAERAWAELLALYTRAL